MDALQQRNASLSGFRQSELQTAIGYMCLQEQQPSGTSAGAFTNGAWRVRALNTAVINRIPGAVVAALPVVTLPRGVYDVFAEAPGFLCDRHVLRLYDVTNAAVLLSGVSALAVGPQGNVISSQTNSFVMGRIYLSAATQLQLEHRCQTSRAGDGMGVAMGTSFAVDVEVYASLEFRKVR